jgi:hypothetical protein
MKRLFVAVVLVGAGCASATSPSGTALGLTHFTSVTTAGKALSGETTMVIQDAATWSAFWASITGSLPAPPALPAVDFSRETVVVASSSGSLDLVQLASAHEKDGTVTVSVMVQKPTGCSFIPELVRPSLDVAKLPVRGRPIVFDVAHSNCAY